MLSCTFSMFWTTVTSQTSSEKRRTNRHTVKPTVVFGSRAGFAKGSHFHTEETVEPLWWTQAGGQPGQPRENRSESIARTSALWASSRCPVWSRFPFATVRSCNYRALGAGTPDLSEANWPVGIGNKPRPRDGVLKASQEAFDVLKSTFPRSLWAACNAAPTREGLGQCSSVCHWRPSRP